MQTITITQPDDWHVHLRDGDALQSTVAASAAHFKRAIVMPNLTPPVTTADAAKSYRARILDAANNTGFEPLMVLYLTDNTSIEDVQQAKASGIVYGFKLYPAGATTNSDAGVSELGQLSHLLAALEEHDLPLLIHGEVTDDTVDIFDREKIFIDRHLSGIVENFPKLRIVLEHITTKDAADFVEQARNGVAATITPQHLAFNRNHMLVGGIRPHLYCLPILKRSKHQEALLAVATSGNPKFFIGTDSAPHSTDKKQSACGCAGCYNSPVALSLYATVFDQENALDKLENFTSVYGPKFYGLPQNTHTITLEKQDWTVPSQLSLGSNQTITPLCAGEILPWRIKSHH